MAKESQRELSTNFISSSFAEDGVGQEKKKNQKEKSRRLFLSFLFAHFVNPISFHLLLLLLLLQLLPSFFISPSRPWQLSDGMELRRKKKNERRNRKQKEEGNWRERERKRKRHNLESGGPKCSFFLPFKFLSLSGAFFSFKLHSFSSVWRRGQVLQEKGLFGPPPGSSYVRV